MLNKKHVLMPHKMWCHEERLKNKETIKASLDNKVL